MKCPNSYPIPNMKVLNYNVTDQVILKIFSYSNVGNILFEPIEISGKGNGSICPKLTLGITSRNFEILNSYTLNHTHCEICVTATR